MNAALIYLCMVPALPPQAPLPLQAPPIACPCSPGCQCPPGVCPTCLTLPAIKKRAVCSCGPDCPLKYHVVRVHQDGTARTIQCDCGCGRQFVQKGSAASVVDIDSSSWSTEVAKPGLLLVDFYATWCGPCRQQRPIIESACRQLDGVARVGAVDVDRNRGLVAQNSVRSIPQLILLKDGQPVYRFSPGVHSQQDIMSTVMRYASQ